MGKQDRYLKAIEQRKHLIKDLPNGEIALKFVDHIVSIKPSAVTAFAIISNIPSLLRMIDFDVEKATRTDVERVVAKINQNPNWTELTKTAKKNALRKLIQYAKLGCCERGTPYPPEVNWIKIKLNSKNSRVTPEALLTLEDFEAIVKAADHPRDKAMVYTLFEGALRPGELLSMRLSSVEFKENHCLITVNGKTGLKRLPLVLSYKPLLEWIERHPRRSEPNAPLWCTLAKNNTGNELEYMAFHHTFQRIIKRARLRKSVWPYLFRHSTLTNMAKVLTEAKLELYAGWVQGSRMARRYVHFSARDLEDSVLMLHGLKNPSDANPLPKMVVCPRCGEANPPGSLHCYKCALVLDKKLAVDLSASLEEKEKKLELAIEKLTADVERIKKLLLENAKMAPA